MTGSLFLLPNFTFVLELVVFLLVLAFMAGYVLPPVRRAVREREDKIRGAVEAAERARAEAERLARERRAVLGAARSKARGIVEEANQAAEESREEGRRRGQEEFERLVAAAQGEIDAARTSARDDVMADLGTLVLHAAERVIGTALGDQRHRVLVAEAIAAATAGAASAAETGNGRPGDGAGTGGAGS